MNNLQRFLSVAVIEWKLQVRTVVFWAGLAIFLLYTLGRVVGIPPEMAFLSHEWIGGREESLIWLSIVLIFLVPSALARDRRAGFILWTTPVTGSLYAAGKLLGIWFTALTLAGIELAAQFLIRMSAWERITPKIASMVLASLEGWLIGIFYVTSIYFLVTVLVRGRALLAYALNILYFVANFAVRDVANPLGFIPVPVFRSDLVGNGMESSLFEAHSMLYMALTIAVIVLALVVYPWRERRSLFPQIERAVLLSGLVFSLGAVGWARSVLLEMRAQVLTRTELSPHPSLLLTAEDVRSVRVTSRLEPEYGFIEGYVELAFERPLENITLYLPAGLKLGSVTNCQTQTLGLIPLSMEWVEIAYAPQVCIAFDGAWRANRADYQTNTGGPEEYALNAEAYIGQGYAYLAPTARWYPAPVGTYEWATPHEIQITLPRAIPSLISPEPTSDIHSESITYQWQSYLGRPFITLAAGDYREVTLPNGDTSWASPEHQHVARQAAAFYLAFLEPLDQLVGHGAFTYQVVETPVLRWPIISGHIVLLPESYFSERLSSALSTRYERNVSSFGAQRAFQEEAYRTVRGWLLGQVSCADASFIGDPVAMPNSSLEPYSGFVPLCESLTHYLSLQLPDRQFGTRRLDEIMQARIKYSDDYLRDSELRQMGGGINGELPAPPYERNWVFNQMFAAIGRLERRVGRKQVNSMISLLLERHYGSAITTADWLEIVCEVAGTEACHEFETTSSPIQVLQLP